MADPLSTIIAHISNLVSFRSSLRLLMIAASIICCWLYIQPELTPLKIPSELSITLITIIGFAIGALLASLLFAIFDAVLTAINAIRNNRKAKREKETAEIELIRQKDEKIEILVKTFDDYSLDAKEILLMLAEKDSVIRIEGSTSSLYGRALHGLLDGKIIFLIKKIDATKGYCTVNPIYKDTLVEIFNSKHRKEVELLIESQPEGLPRLLNKFKDTQKEEDYVYNIEKLIYKNRYNYSPVILFEEYDEGEFGKCTIQFYINEHHYPFMVEIMSQSIREYILGNVKNKDT